MKMIARGRKLILLPLCAVILVFAVLIGCSKEKLVSKNENSAIDNTGAVNQIPDKLSLDSELIRVSCIGSVAKIDIVTPGLDTCSIRVVFYDLNSEKVLSETDLSSGSWITGQTENGFYAAEQSEKTLYVYDNSGKLETVKNFSDKDGYLVACGVDGNENYFVYNTSREGEVYVYNLKTDEENKLSEGVFLRENLGFRGSVLYAQGIDGTVISINPETGAVKTEVNDRRLNLFSPYYSIGTTDYNYIVADKNTTSYIPFASIDELVVGIGKEGFTTAVSHSSGDKLRIYNFMQKKVAEAFIDGTVESVCYTDDNRLIVITGNAFEKKHNLSVCDLKSINTASLEISNKDIPQNIKTEIQIPEAQESKKATVIEGVPVISQFPEFPTGCEAVSTVTVLRFYGEEISCDKFIDKYLPRNADFYYDSGKRFGPSPYEYFIGNPRTAASYGCMAPVIEKALCDYFGNSGRVRNTTGTELDDLCSEYIDNGMPVIMWATINMQETNPKNTWYLSDGTRFTWPGNEHCLVLKGYDAENYYFNDPYAGKTVKFKKQTVKDRYAELGKQSLVLFK